MHLEDLEKKIIRTQACDSVLCEPDEMIGCLES